MRDLSAEIALAYLRSPQCWELASGAQAVTGDHLDQDGLVSAYALTDPAGALARAAMLVEVARVGDFAVVRDIDAACVAFALAVLDDPSRSPIPEIASADSSSADRFRELLGRLPQLLDRPDLLEGVAGDELESLRLGRSSLERGEIVIEQPGQLDGLTGEAGVVVVTFGGGCVQPTVSRFAKSSSTHVVHPAVVHGATDAMRVLTVSGRRYRNYDRYETWVRFASRRLPLRRDLGPLAAELSAAEQGHTRWLADSPGTLEPMLYVAEGDESSLEPGAVADVIGRYLLSAPPAWDPWQAGTPLSERAASRAGTSGRDRSRWRDRLRGRSSA